MYGVKRTTIYLTEKQKAGLETAAADSGRTEADLIREGVDHVLLRHGPKPPKPRTLTDKWDPLLDTPEGIDEAMKGFGED